MKHNLTHILSALLVGCILLTSCARSVTAPLKVTNNPVGTKKGVAKATTYFGFGKVDIGIEKAAKNGKIARVATVDMKIKVGPLPFIARYETIVTGTGPGEYDPCGGASGTEGEASEEEEE